VTKSVGLCVVNQFTNLSLVSPDWAENWSSFYNKWS